MDEILFDDAQWTVRYLVVDTGGWLTGRKILIPPVALGALDWDRHLLNVNLTRDQVEQSPAAEMDKPVSRQWETDRCPSASRGGGSRLCYGDASMGKPAVSAEVLLRRI